MKGIYSNWGMSIILIRLAHPITDIGNLHPLLILLTIFVSSGERLRFIKLCKLGLIMIPKYMNSGTIGSWDVS